MNHRLFVCLIAVLCLAACENPEKKKSKEKEKAKAAEHKIPDQNADVAFQSFVGRLRKAAAARDVQALAPLMSPNFGYRIEPLGEGEGVFQYWQENDLWKELQLVLNEKFVPKGDFMVAPPQFAADPEHFNGYRAGLTMLNGAWRFAYFVKD